MPALLDPSLLHHRSSRCQGGFTVTSNTTVAFMSLYVTIEEAVIKQSKLGGSKVRETVAIEGRG